jgi:hypothetical protein
MSNAQKIEDAWTFGSSTQKTTDSNVPKVQDLDLDQWIRSHQILLEFVVITGVYMFIIMMLNTTGYRDLGSANQRELVNQEQNCTSWINIVSSELSQVSFINK